MGEPSSGEVQDAGSDKALVQDGEGVLQCVAEVLSCDLAGMTGTLRSSVR